MRTTQCTHCFLPSFSRPVSSQSRDLWPFWTLLGQLLTLGVGTVFTQWVSFSSLPARPEHVGFPTTVSNLSFFPFVHNFCPSVHNFPGVWRPWTVAGTWREGMRDPEGLAGVLGAWPAGCPHPTPRKPGGGQWPLPGQRCGLLLSSVLLSGCWAGFWSKKIIFGKLPRPT